MDHLLWADQIWLHRFAGTGEPRVLVVCLFFNHQTHHRGQFHAALTESGVAMSVTDLPFMPGVD